MMSNFKIIYLKKYGTKTNSNIWNRLTNYKNNLSQPLEQIIEKFSGIEGTITRLLQINEIKELSNNLIVRNTADEIILFVEILRSDDSSLKNSNLNFLGYDYGCPVRDEFDVYSSIFNEIIFGHINELVQTKSILNNNLLFNSFCDAANYRALHNQVRINGVDVEHDQCLNILKISQIKYD